MELIMTELLLNNEPAIRIGFFITVFALMAIWEIITPRRELTTPKAGRWINNFGIIILNTAIVRILWPTAAVGVAIYAQGGGWGLLNVVSIPEWVVVMGSVVAMDLAIYLQHALFHAVPGLWRLHRVHHADLDYDVTTGARFHPIEIVLSMVLKLGVVVSMGAPPLGVLIFEIVLNATALFNHSNILFPLPLDKTVRLLLVTPDMHRVHHSVEDHEANSNFGFNLSIWDRIFGTYLDQPEKGHLGMEIGIRGFRDPAKHTLPWMLALPFMGKVSGYVINRRNWESIEDE
jgi:sterol desaturase/sphingolipid hydroxylase (fatty acid hydroxylase superfamily)